MKKQSIKFSKFLVVATTLFAVISVFPAAAQTAEGSEKTWTNFVSESISAPFYILNSEKSGDIFSNGFYNKISYLGISDSNFALSVDFGIGTVLSKDFQPRYSTEKPLCAGLGLNLNIGAGHAFVNNEKIKFAVLAETGIDYMRFKHKKDIVSYAAAASETLSHTSEQTQTTDIFVFNIGLDAVLTVQFTKLMGFFADASLRYAVIGNMNTHGEYMDKDYSLQEKIYGYVTIIPSAGICFKF